MLTHGSLVGQECECLVEWKRILVDFATRMRENEPAAGQAEDVDLDDVDSSLQRKLERAERVRRSQSGGPTVADP